MIKHRWTPVGTPHALTSSAPACIITIVVFIFVISLYMAFSEVFMFVLHRLEEATNNFVEAKMATTLATTTLVSARASRATRS